MGIDIRMPIGWLFIILGLLLVGWGMISGPAIYARSLNINVNVDWGIVMVLFGGVMLALTRLRPAALEGDSQ